LSAGAQLIGACRLAVNDQIKKAKALTLHDIPDDSSLEPANGGQDNDPVL